MFIRAQGKQAQHGFTLMEALVATMILGFALASILGVAGRSMRYLNDIRRTARASQVLQQKMEDIRLLSWSQMQTLSNSFTDPTDTAHVYDGRVLTNQFDSYGSTTTVMRVTLIVSWTNQTNQILSNQLTTLISMGGLNKYIF